MLDLKIECLDTGFLLWYHYIQIDTHLGYQIGFLFLKGILTKTLTHNISHTFCTQNFTHSIIEYTDL